MPPAPPDGIGYIFTIGERILTYCRFLLTIGPAVQHTNVEIKARCRRPAHVRDVLKRNGAVFKGVDHQVDTYYNVIAGRLKLREGLIENALIYYTRPDQTAPKTSNVLLYTVRPDPTLKAILRSALGVYVEVVKKREIYFIDNVKFHVDAVDGLGSFVEIEAIASVETSSSDLTTTVRSRTYGGEVVEELHRQCDEYIDLLGIKKDDLLSFSYSDMLRHSD